MQPRVDKFPIGVGGIATIILITIKSSKERRTAGMNIADRIQSLRKIKGVSQEELADKIGVTRQAVSKWESEQSTPDIEKVILLSDYFDVTTDYLLKGIESVENQKIKKNIAPIFNIVATTLNVIGNVMACFLWSETQKTGAIVAGMIFIILGTMLFFVGMSQSSGKDKEMYACKFWKINGWLVSFVPVSVFYNALFGVVAPYPIPFANFILVFVAFWLAYIGVMIYVTYSQSKKEKASIQ